MGILKIKKWLLAKNVANVAGQYHLMHGNIWTKQMADESIKAAADVPIEVLKSTMESLKETLVRGDKEIIIKVNETHLWPK